MKAYVESWIEDGRLQVQIDLKGDLPGHPFRGNQWEGGQGDEPSENTGVDRITAAGFVIPDKTGFSELHQKAQQSIASVLVKLASEFPGITAEIGSVQLADDMKDVPFSIVAPSEGKRYMKINRKMLSPEEYEQTMKDVERSQNNGFLAGGGGLSGVVVHEAAHIIEQTSYKHTWPGVRQAKLYIKKNPPKAKDLSKYGVSQQSEMFPEALSGLLTSNRPRSKWMQGFAAVYSLSQKI